MSSLVVETVLRGYHVYIVMWEACVGESFILLHESGNDHDKHAIVVYRDEDPGVIVGHIPRKIGNFWKKSVSFRRLGL